MGGEVDPIDAAHRRRVAVRRSGHVDGAVGERQRAPDELAAEVGEDAQRPAVVLGAGGEVERVQPAEGVGDVERVGSLVDDAGADDAVAVELLAALRELTDVDAPAESPVGGERCHLARRGGGVEGAVGREHLADDPAVQRKDEVAGESLRRHAAGIAGACRLVAEGRPARGRCGRGRVQAAHGRAHDDQHPHARDHRRST